MEYNYTVNIPFSYTNNSLVYMLLVLGLLTEWTHESQESTKMKYINMDNKSLREEQ